MVEHMPPTWPLLSDYPFQQLTVCVCVCVCVCGQKKMFRDTYIEDIL